MAAEPKPQSSSEGDASLVARLASELGFEHGRRNGDGNKKALHTTTISGRSHAEDPRSLVVFDRSHLGGFGDLLQMLLRKRSPKHNVLTIQSDLSTVNFASDEALRRRFTFDRVVAATLKPRVGSETHSTTLRVEANRERGHHFLAALEHFRTRGAVEVIGLHHQQQLFVRRRLTVLLDETVVSRAGLPMNVTRRVAGVVRPDTVHVGGIFDWIVHTWCSDKLAARQGDRRQRHEPWEHEQLGCRRKRAAREEAERVASFELEWTERMHASP